MLSYLDTRRWLIPEWLFGPGHGHNCLWSLVKVGFLDLHYFFWNFNGFLWIHGPWIIHQVWPPLVSLWESANPGLRTRSSSFLHFSISISRSSSLTSFKCFSHLVRLFVTSTVRRDSYWILKFYEKIFKKSTQGWNENGSHVTWLRLYLITFVSFERNLCSVASDWMLALAFLILTNQTCAALANQKTSFGQRVFTVWMVLSYMHWL